MLKKVKRSRKIMEVFKDKALIVNTKKPDDILNSIQKRKQ